MKRSIKIKIINIFTWLLLVAFVIVSMGFVASEKKAIFCNAIKINIDNSCSHLFIHEQEVLSLLKKNEFEILGYPIQNIDITKIEDYLIANSSIKDAQVYKTIDGKLIIDIEQRNPILRIINYNYESYFIDDEGKLMPLSPNYTPRILVVTGNVNEPYSMWSAFNKPIHKVKDELNRESNLKDYYELAKIINNDPLMFALTEQIYVNFDNEIEIIPKTGSFNIILGDLSSIEDKIIKLKEFLYVAAANEGWNKYKTINLKFKNQIVCTKK